MLNYIFDGSFEGLLTAIYEAYYRREEPQNIFENGDFQLNMFEKNTFITADIDKSTKVYNAIKEKISLLALQDIYHVYLADSERDRGTLIYNYIRLGWKLGTRLSEHLSNDHVLKIQNIRRKVTFECHRMLGLIRFSQLQEDIYYAPIEPDNNIVGLLAPHFASRMSDQNWVIHDIRRNMAAVFNKDEWVLTSLDRPPQMDLCEREAFYRNLWKQYFVNIAIKSRINPGLQKRCMPVRYWRYLVEKE